MEDGIIYTFGSLDTLVIILEGLATLFDPLQNSFFVSDSGLGVGVGGTLAATLALMGVFTNYITQQKLVPHGPLVGLLVYALVAVPSIDRVFVSDLYTGETVAVSDVPLGVALVGVVMSTITYNIIEESERAYGTSPIAGSPYEAKLSQGQGFLSPMKTLFKLRQNISPSTPSHLVYNMFAYSKYCLYASVNHVSAVRTAGSPNFNMLTFKQSTNPLTTYFLDTDLIDRNLITEMMDPTSGNESFTQCEILNDLLSNNAPGGIGYFLNDGATYGRHLLTQLATSDETMLSECAAGGICLDGTSAITDTKDIIGQILGGVAQSEAYMEARMATDFNNVIGLAPTLDAASLANATSMNREAIELVRLTEVLEGETFLRFMIPAMNSILFIFYATFPLAMVIMVTKGAEALKYLGGFMLIGVWAYSWMPIATVINLITISNVGEALNTSRNLFGINVQSSPQLLELAMDQLATGSNLLAATPIITLAIISGSLYALTSVAANSAAPSGAASGVARANTSSGHTGSSLVATQPAYSDKHGLKTTGAINQHSAAIAGTRSISQSQNWDSSSAELQTQQSQQQAQFKKMLKNTLGAGSSASSGSTIGGGVGMSAETRSSVARMGAEQLQKAGIQVTGASTQEMDAVNTALGLGIGVAGSVDAGFLAGLAGKAVKYLSKNGKIDKPNDFGPSDGADGVPAGDMKTNPGDPGALNQGNGNSDSPFSLTGTVSANGGASWTGQDIDSFMDSITKEARTTSGDTVSNEDGAGNSRNSALSLLKSHGLDNNAEFSKIRSLGEEMSSTASEIEQYQSGSSSTLGFANTKNMDLADSYSRLSQSGTNNGQDFNFHGNRLNSMMQKAGFSDSEIEKGLGIFNKSRESIKSSMYAAGGNGPDVNYYAGAEAYDHAIASVSGNTIGSEFGSEARDNAFKSVLQTAGATQFDHMDPNSSRSEQVDQILQNISDGKANPMFLDEAQKSGITEDKKSIEEAVDAGGMENATKGSAFGGVSSDYSNPQTKSASDQLNGTGFTPQRSPVKGADNLNDAYFTSSAKDAFSQAYNGKNYGELTGQEKQAVDTQRFEGAMADIADHNRGIAGKGYTTPEQTDLIDSTSSGDAYVREASGFVNQAVRGGLNNNPNIAGAQNMSKKIQAFDSATSGMLSEKQSERKQNMPSGFSQSELSSAIDLAKNTDSPAEYNRGINAQYSQVSPQSSNKGEGGSSPIGNGSVNTTQSDYVTPDPNGRTLPNTDKAYESARTPLAQNGQPQIGNLENLAYAAETVGVQGERRTLADDAQDRVASIVPDVAQGYISDLTGVSMKSNITMDPEQIAASKFFMAANEKISNRLENSPNRDEIQGRINQLNSPTSQLETAQYISQASNILQEYGQARL